MTRSLCTVFVSLIMLVHLVNSQNLPVCIPNQTPAPGNLPFPTISNTAQVQLNIERLNPVLPVAEEITEFFDGINNYGIARQLVAGNYVRSYSYYSTNELLLVRDGKCKVLKLNESSDDTPFPVTTIDGVEHILSPLNVLTNNQNLKFVYIGQIFPVRGIQVNQWQACAYSDREKKNYNIVISFSDPNKWAPAATTAAIPVELVIEATSADGIIKTDYYTITQYRPFLLLEEEDYFTGPGIYCEGRSPGKPVPDMPDSFSFIIQETQPIPGTVPANLAGTIAYGYEEYNYKYKLFRHDYVGRGNIQTTEIHDFVTGLNYKFNRFSGNCSVAKLVNTDIDSEVVDGQLVIRNPNEFFDFDNVPFQYVGLKREDGVNNDVWIGPKKINGLDCLLEWYFLADQWNRTDLVVDEKRRYKIPIELRIYTDLSTETQKIVTINRFQVTNFRKRDFHPSDFDISICDSQLNKRFFRFSLQSDLIPEIKAGLIDFKAVVATMLQSEARVSILRLSKFEVIFDSTAAYVLFTLFERSSTYGVNPAPVDDLKSDDAIKLLKSSFIAGRILIDFKTVTDEVIIPTDPNSFEEIGNYEEGFIIIKKEVVLEGFTEGTVAIVTIVITLVGLALGFFVTILQKNNKINIPGLKTFYN